MDSSQMEKALDSFRCPRSGAALRFEALGAGGVLRSSSADWPWLMGIAVFEEGPEAARALALLESGDQLGAAAVLASRTLRDRTDRIQSRLEQWLLRRPSAEGPASRRMRRRLGRLPRLRFPDAARLLFGRPPWPVPQTGSYFVHRRSDPSFVAAERISLELLSGRSRILDLGCGTGHLLASLAAGGLGSSLLAGVDSLFPALLLARAYLAPDALLVCAEADRLPFRDGAFDGLASVDAFFDFGSLPGAAGEMRRVLDEDGVAVLPHLHNRLVPHIYSGRSPLTPSEYLEVLGPLGAGLIDERAVLAAMTGRGSSELAVQQAGDALDGAADLIAVGGQYEKHVKLDPGWVPPAAGPFRINPLYHAASGTREFERSSYRYISEDESGPVPGLLPASFALPEGVASVLGSETVLQGAEELVRCRALLPLPHGYDGPVSARGEASAPPPAPRRHRRGVTRWAREIRSRFRASDLQSRLRSLAGEMLPQGGLAILAGHRLSGSRGDDPLDLVVPGFQLERLLDALRPAGTLLSFEEAIERLLTEALPDGLSFTLSFDDGSEDLLEHAPALLERQGLSAAVFVTGEDSARGGRYHWDKLGGGGRRADPRLFAERAAVFSLGHHSRTHRALEGLTSEEIREELAPLEVPTGPWLAYPFGQPKDAGPRAAELARSLGFRAGLTTRRGIARPGDDPMLLPRMPLYDVPPDSLLRNLVAALEALR